MRPVLVKELRELAPVAIPACAVLLWIGTVDADRPYQQFMRSATGGAAGGALIGAIQGWLDRRARGDAFLLHRPAGAARIHATRTIAGAVAAVAAAVTFHVGIGLHRAFLPDDPMSAWTTLTTELDPSEPVDFTASAHPLALRALVGAAAALSMWSALRISVGRPSYVRAGLLALTLPPLLAASLLAAGGLGVCVAAACAAAAGLSVLAIADLTTGAEASR